MKKRTSDWKSLLLCLLLLPAVNFSLSAQEAKREFHESYDVKQGVTLSADIKYADVELVTWDKDAVDILAEVKVEASSQSRAEEKLSKVDVRISKSGSTISLENDMEEGWSKDVKKVDIHITVQAPEYMNLTLEQTYGDVFIQELSGLVLMDLKYGNLKAGGLTRGNEKPYNHLDLAYSNGTVDQGGWMEAELAYSELEIGNSSMLFVNSKYSKLLGESTGGIVTDGSYDKYYFDKVENFVAELKYSGVKFGSLTKKFEVESKYTNIKIEKVSKDFKEISVESSYGNIYLGVETGASYKIEAEARYGKISLDDAGGKLNRTKENNYMKISGSVGDMPKGSMSLVARYGNIEIE
jgi:hypothetical protein